MFFFLLRMSQITNITHVIDRIESALPNTSTKLKTILAEIYKSQLLVSDREKNESFSSLFQELLEFLNIELSTKESSIHDVQIQAIHDQVKSDLDNWKQKWFPSTLDQAYIDSLFMNLIDIIQSAFKRISIVFQDVSVRFILFF